MLIKRLTSMLILFSFFAFATTTLAASRDLNQALFDAVIGNDSARVDAALSAGADANATFEFSGGEVFTLVHLWLMIYSDNPDPAGLQIVRALVAAGYDVHTKDPVGVTALQRAESEGATEIAAILAEGGSSAPSDNASGTWAAFSSAPVDRDADDLHSVYGIAWGFGDAESALEGAISRCIAQGGETESCETHAYYYQAPCVAVYEVRYSFVGGGTEQHFGTGFGDSVSAATSAARAGWGRQNPCSNCPMETVRCVAD